MPVSTEHRNTMFSIIENWQQSGLSQKTFCEEQHIKAHVFYYWYKCYRIQNNTLVVQPAKRFIELRAPAILPEASIELLLANGHRILFHQPVAASFIKAIIS